MFSDFHLRHWMTKNLKGWGREASFSNHSPGLQTLNYTASQSFCLQEAPGEGHNGKYSMGGSRGMELLSSLMELLSHLLTLETEGAKPFWGRVVLSNRLEAVVFKIPSPNIHFFMTLDNFFWKASLGKTDTTPISLNTGSHLRTCDTFMLIALLHGEGGGAIDVVNGDLALPDCGSCPESPGPFLSSQLDFPHPSCFPISGNQVSWA